jgi:hypothetical protein
MDTIPATLQSEGSSDADEVRVGVLVGAVQARVLLEARLGQRLADAQDQVAVGDRALVLGQHADQRVAEGAVRLRVVARGRGIGGRLVVLTPAQQNARVWPRPVARRRPHPTVRRERRRRVHAPRCRRVARRLIRRVRVQLRLQKLPRQPRHHAHHSAFRTCTLYHHPTHPRGQYVTARNQLCPWMNLVRLALLVDEYSTKSALR